MAGRVGSKERNTDGDDPDSRKSAGQGYGNPVEKDTEFVSGLYDPFWYEQEEYKYAQEDGCQVSFLSQPPRHFLGEAWYERTFVISERDFGAGKEGLEEWFLRIELTHWRTRVWIDGEYLGRGLLSVYCP